MHFSSMFHNKKVISCVIIFTTLSLQLLLGFHPFSVKINCVEDLLPDDNLNVLIHDAFTRKQSVP